jgi:hypothetical protein
MGVHIRCGEPGKKNLSALTDLIETKILIFTT